MMKQWINIAGIQLEIISENPINHSEIYKRFLCYNRKVNLASWQILLKKVNILQNVEAPIFRELDYGIDAHLNRLYYDRLDRDQLYAVTHTDIENRQAIIEYLDEKSFYFKEWHQVFFHMGWEKLLVLENVIALHAACIESQFGGILFSGKSGIGKSTQADLWCRYEGSTLINGDRPLIRKNPEGEAYLAYGSPYAGSSRCYKNESCPIHSIVFLQQSPECRIRRLKASEAFQKIYSQTTLYSWDREYMEHACSVIEGLIGTITVYELSCTPDEDAVKLLKETLEEEEG